MGTGATALPVGFILLVAGGIVYAHSTFNVVDEKGKLQGEILIGVGIPLLIAGAL